MLEVGVAPATAKKLAHHGLDLVRRAVATWYTQRREVGGKMENHPGIVIFWLSNLDKAGIPPTLPAVWFESDIGKKYGGDQPAPEQSTRPSYAVDLPGVYRLPVVATPEPAKPLPPPLAHDDPWAQFLIELPRQLPADSPGPMWLQGSRFVYATDVAGVPLYQVHVVDQRGVDWVVERLQVEIRKKMTVLMGKRLLVETVLAELEPTL